MKISKNIQTRGLWVVNLAIVSFFSQLTGIYLVIFLLIDY